MKEKDIALQATQKALYVVSPMLARLMDATIGSVNTSEEAAKSGDIDLLQMEAKRQELTMQMAERQAKVAQELALARRIETAEEVEMEEFYDVSGTANIGAKAGEESITVGLSGHGQKVTKRIFRFKGNVSVQTSP
jgi:hypothetical protein